MPLAAGPTGSPVTQTPGTTVAARFEQECPLPRPHQVPLKYDKILRKSEVALIDGGKNGGMPFFKKRFSLNLSHTGLHTPDRL